MKSVRLVEMGLRDGLQNEKALVDVKTRVEFARKLSDAGVRNLEVGAFVSPKWVPQMAGSGDVLKTLREMRRQKKLPQNIQFSVLVPNEHGWKETVAAGGAEEIAIFAACSESFSFKNINCSIDESFKRFAVVAKAAKKSKTKLRGYLSVCFGCPFEGNVSETKVVELAKRMLDLGAHEISIGDTIGVANPAQVARLFKKLLKVIPAKRLAGHFHDTRGTALANVLAAYQLGIKTFDTSAGGLGGCPYAPNATGNVATEDVAYMFHGMGVDTGLDLAKLIEMQPWITEQVKHPLSSKVGRAGLLKPLGPVAGPRNI